MKFTNYFKFKKPEPQDTVNVKDFNDTFDLIDGELKKTQDSLHGVTFDYDSLKTIMIDENNAANLQNQVTQVKSDLRQNVNWLNLEALGLDMQGNTESSSIINNAIQEASEGDVLYIPNGNVFINSPIFINKGITLKCDATMIYSGSDYAVKHTAANCNIEIKKIVAHDGGGYSIIGESTLLFGNDIMVENIICKKKGVYLCNNGYGVQYNTFSSKLIKSNEEEAIYCYSNSQWIGENRFNNAMLQGSTAIKLEATDLGEITGTRGNNLSFEGSTIGIEITNSKYNSFVDCRNQEVGSGKTLVLSGKCTGNIIRLDTILLSKIDIINAAITSVSYIYGFVMNNQIDYSYVGDTVTLNGKTIECSPLTRKVKNLYTDSTATSTLNWLADIDESSKYNFYTDFMLIPNVTFTIGKSYYNPKFQDLLLSLQTGTKIKDSDGNIIINSDNTSYNYKVIRIKRLSETFGVNKWQVELVTTIS